MYQVAMNRCLNKEAKLYGLSYLGVIGGGVIGLMVWLKFGMVFGIVGSSVGYTVTAYVAKYLHSGAIQRFAYWYLPMLNVFRSTRYLPPSYYRCFL